MWWQIRWEEAVVASMAAWHFLFGNVNVQVEGELQRDSPSFRPS